MKTKLRPVLQTRPRRLATVLCLNRDVVAPADRRGVDASKGAAGPNIYRLETDGLWPDAARSSPPGRLALRLAFVTVGVVARRRGNEKRPGWERGCLMRRASGAGSGLRRPRGPGTIAWTS